MDDAVVLELDSNDIIYHGTEVVARQGVEWP